MTHTQKNYHFVEVDLRNTSFKELQSKFKELQSKGEEFYKDDENNEKIPFVLCSETDYLILKEKNIKIYEKKVIHSPVERKIKKC